MTETMTEKQATGAFEKFLELLKNIERTKKQAFSDFKKATEALAAAKKSYAAAELNREADLIDDKELKQAAKALEDASIAYDKAKLRYEASMSPDAFSEVVAEGSKGRKLAEEAVAEGKKAMDELEKKRKQLSDKLPELKEKYLALVEEYFKYQAEEMDISKQLKQIAEVVPDIVPPRYIRDRERGYMTYQEFLIIEKLDIYQRIYNAVPKFRCTRYL